VVWNILVLPLKVLPLADSQRSCSVEILGTLSRFAVAV